jgi:hypothetical protein
MGLQTISHKCKIIVSLYLCLYSPCGSWPLFQFLNLYTVGRTPWTGDQLVARPLPARRTIQTQNKRTQISVPLMGFEPPIPVFELSKTVHTLDRTVTVIGKYNIIVPWNMAVRNFRVFTIHNQSLKTYNSPTAQCVSLRDRLRAKRPQPGDVSCSKNHISSVHCFPRNRTGLLASPWSFVYRPT